MDYPNDFDTPAFPAGKSIAWSRVVAVKISIVFFLIVCLCGLLFFVVRAKKNFPFIVSVDPLTDEWTVVTYPQDNRNKNIETYQIIQEKLVNDFVTNWFTISDNQSENGARWQECDEKKCTEPERFNPQSIECGLYCATSSELFTEFSSRVRPEYIARINQASEKWTVSKRDIRPYFVTQNESAWQVYIAIHSNISGTFNVFGFVNVKLSDDGYPATLGYYISNFNSYRVQQ